MSDLHPIISLSLMLGMVCSLVWISAETMRRMMVRGSHGRYVWASAERAARWPAGVWMVLSAGVEFKYGSGLVGMFNCLASALWLLLLLEKRRDGNDDDFWSSLKKRLQSGVRVPGFETGS